MVVDGWGQRMSVDPGKHRNGALVVVVVCGQRGSVDPG